MDLLFPPNHNYLNQQRKENKHCLLCVVLFFMEIYHSMMPVHEARQQCLNIFHFEKIKRPDQAKVSRF